MTDSELRALFGDYWMARQAASESLTQAKDRKNSPTERKDKYRCANYWLARLSAMSKSIDEVFRVDSRSVDLLDLELRSSADIIPFPKGR